MSNFNKFETNSYCVCGRHYSGTKKIRGVSNLNELRC